ncbi:hypothetical protein SAMN05421690_102435 [Nitrosomonas sp. Nm51]|uniref:hypothetical protein n=1 Tax=Nitrosomonas sp. Nm51 TaxID=133720 RepID=UPI0008B77694|nr:hypothetical protein [Nitrosomonas sp. Nm51]SER40650.1 hypothetical protein SAMN05421690_102435 [Nitrosomonas sp. Nm51]
MAIKIANDYLILKAKVFRSAFRILLSSGAMRRSHPGMSDDMGSEDSRVKACPLVNAELAFVFEL